MGTPSLFNPHTLDRALWLPLFVWEVWEHDGLLFDEYVMHLKFNALFDA